MLAKYLLSFTYSKLGWLIRPFLILWLQSGKSNQPARSVYRNKGSITKLDVNRNAIKSLIDRIERFRVKPGREIVCVGLCLWLGVTRWHKRWHLVLTTAVTSVNILFLSTMDSTGSTPLPHSGKVPFCVLLSVLPITLSWPEAVYCSTTASEYNAEDTRLFLI